MSEPCLYDRLVNNVKQYEEAALVQPRACTERLLTLLMEKTSEYAHKGHSQVQLSIKQMWDMCTCERRHGKVLYDSIIILGFEPVIAVQIFHHGGNHEECYVEFNNVEFRSEFVDPSQCDQKFAMSMIVGFSWLNPKSPKAEHLANEAQVQQLKDLSVSFEYASRRGETKWEAPWEFRLFPKTEKILTDEGLKIEFSKVKATIKVGPGGANVYTPSVTISWDP